MKYVSTNDIKTTYRTDHRTIIVRIIVPYTDRNMCRLQIITEIDQ